MAVIAPPETERFPHWRPVITPPPVSAAVNNDPEPVEHIVCELFGVTATVDKPEFTVIVPVATGLPPQLPPVN